MALALACPVCQADAAGAPDMFGVRRCGGCGVEFRPPGRVPVRNAGVSEIRDESRLGWVVFVVVGVSVGVAMALGDANAPTGFDRAGELAGIQPLLVVPSFEPEALDFGELGTGLGGAVELEFELETKQVYEGELFVTGWVVNPSAAEVSGVEVELSCRDRQGDELAYHSATVACPDMRGKERCAWALEVGLPAGGVELEFAAHAVRDSPRVFERLSKVARFGAQGEALDAEQTRLRFDPESALAGVELPPDLILLDAWFTLTALDDAGRVLDVRSERAQGSLSGVAELRIAGSRRDDAVAVHELRVGGSMLPPLELPPVELAPLELPPVELPPIELP